MGLDMYLNVKKFVSGNSWTRKSATEDSDYAPIAKKEVEGYDFISSHFNVKGDEPFIRGNKFGYLELNVGYWRKANAIHNWFVTNVQQGKDDCEPYRVSRSKLEELKALCEKILEGASEFDEEDYEVEIDWTEESRELIENELPPTGGFFFGDTDINYYFWEDLKSTVEQIESIFGHEEFKHEEFYYQASW